MTGTEWIAPTVSGSFTVLVLLLGTYFTIRARKNGSVEAKTPSTTEAWAEADKARDGRNFFQDVAYLIRSAFRGYVARTGGYESLTEDERFAHDQSLTYPQKENAE